MFFEFMWYQQPSRSMVRILYPGLFCKGQFGEAVKIDIRIKLRRLSREIKPPIDAKWTGPLRTRKWRYFSVCDLPVVNQNFRDLILDNELTGLMFHPLTFLPNPQAPLEQLYFVSVSGRCDYALPRQAGWYEKNKELYDQFLGVKAANICDGSTGVILHEDSINTNFFVTNTLYTSFCDEKAESILKAANIPLLHLTPVERLFYVFSPFVFPEFNDL